MLSSDPPRGEGRQNFPQHEKRQSSHQRRLSPVSSVEPFVSRLHVNKPEKTTLFLPSDPEFLPSAPFPESLEMQPRWEPTPLRVSAGLGLARGSRATPVCDERWCTRGEGPRGRGGGSGCTWAPTQVKETSARQGPSVRAASAAAFFFLFFF